MCGIFAFYGTTGSEEQLKSSFAKLTHRGPDASNWYRSENLYLGFHRLALMDLSSAGMQPFHSSEHSLSVICNGEIYNHEALRRELVRDRLDEGRRSRSDCEVLVPLLKNYGLRKTCESLDGEFSFIFFDSGSGQLQAARDPMGIRPLFYGYAAEGGEIAFASEAKALLDFCTDVKAFPTGHYYDGQGFIRYHSYEISALCATQMSRQEAEEGLRAKLVTAVEKRLHADAHIGFLLSGGLDSSLVCAIAANKLERPIKTFAIGIEGDAIDTKYAREVAAFIGSDHTEVIFTKQQVRDCLPAVIAALESFDITTVRASVGMYLICEHIQNFTPIKALLTGEVSDELFGYKYTDYAPSPAAFQDEAIKRVTELLYYDVLRADRCLAAHSLEARVPFSDRDFAEFALTIPAEYKMNRGGVGKNLLRSAFAETGLLPDSILYREKAAFSDAVGHSMVDELKCLAESYVADFDLRAGQSLYSHCPPLSKESLLYRDIFESTYRGMGELIPGYWLPNRSWQHCDVDEPSARILPNYGLSGQ